MWFRNLQIYRLPKSWANSPDELEIALAAQPLSACGASDAQSFGWLAPRPNSEKMIHNVGGQWLISLGVQHKLLPMSVVKQLANERAKDILEAEGRRVGRKEMRELIENATSELLPRAFVCLRRTFAWIDPTNGWLVIDAASSKKAEELLEYLRKSAGNFPAKLIKTELSPSAAMTAWLAEGKAPGRLTIDQDLELCSPEKAKVRYVKHTLEGEEIRQHIGAGKVVSKLALTWYERISFVFDENMQIKRLACLDVLQEENENQAESDDERFDLDFTLMTGEVAKLLTDLLDALGGELAS